MIVWNYSSADELSSGYESVMDKLKTYTKESYETLTEREKLQVVDEVFKIYRSINIFPITYYNNDGVRNEILKCINKDVVWDGSDVLNFSYNQGQSLCRWLFPNMQDVVCKGIKENSPYYKFHNDHKLKRAIKFCLDHKSTKTPVTPTGIKDGLEMLGGNVATNFKTMNAKALYQHFCKDGDAVLDFSAGFGGRMLGALASNLIYVGLEPSTETYENLNKLGEYFSSVKDCKYKIVKRGSEIPFSETWHEKFDFAFSSPPYFNLEVYSDEDSQCYTKFPTLDQWFDGYVTPTIQNIYDSLKVGKYYAVNIADFKIGNNTIEFVDEWIKRSVDIGFVYDRQIFLSLQVRRGQGHDQENKKTKQEGIFIFKKP